MQKNVNCFGKVSAVGHLHFVTLSVCFVVAFQNFSSWYVKDKEYENIFPMLSVWRRLKESN